jgi:hypothetical protein
MCISMIFILLSLYISDVNIPCTYVFYVVLLMYMCFGPVFPYTNSSVVAPAYFLRFYRDFYHCSVQIL